MAYLTETKNIVSVWERERWKGKMTHYLMQAGCDAMTCISTQSKPLLVHAYNIRDEIESHYVQWTYLVK